jgi:hypothetical protein
MESNMTPRESVHVAEVPNLPGLTFRCFRGELDYPAMVAVMEGSKEVDGLERTDTVEDVAWFYNKGDSPQKPPIARAVGAQLSPETAILTNPNF